MEFIWLFIGMAVGAAFTWLILRNKTAAAVGVDPVLLADAEKQKAVALQQAEDLRGQLLKSENEMGKIRSELSSALSDSARAQAQLKAMDERMAEHKSDLGYIRQQM